MYVIYSQRSRKNDIFRERQGKFCKTLKFESVLCVMCYLGVLCTILANFLCLKIFQKKNPNHWRNIKAHGSISQRKTLDKIVIQSLFIQSQVTALMLCKMFKNTHKGSSVQLLSCVWLGDPVNRSMPRLPVHHQLPEFTQTHVHRVGDAIQPSHPLSSPSPPAPNPSQHQGLFQWVNTKVEQLPDFSGR